MDFMHGHNRHACSARSTRRSQSFKCLGPANSAGLHCGGIHSAGIHAGPHCHAGKPNSLPPRAVMRSFLSAQGHLSSAGRLAKPACSASSSSLSVMAQKESSMSTSDLSSDLLHALERQGRNSIDAANSSSLAPSRHSMDTDEGPHRGAAAPHADVALLPMSSAPLSSCLMTAPRHSFGSRTDDDLSGPMHSGPRCGGDEREWCSDAGASCAPIVPAPAPNAVAAAAGCMLQGSVGQARDGGGGQHQQKSRLHLAMAQQGAGPPTGQPHPPLHALLRGNHGPSAHGLRAADTAPAVAVAMSSALFRPVAVAATAAAATASHAAPRSGTSSDSCDESTFGDLCSTRAPEPCEAEVRHAR